MNRRNFISILGALALTPLLNGSSLNQVFAADNNSFQDENNATEQYIFNQMLKEISNNKWNTLPIGELMAKIGQLFVGFPYQAGLLEMNAKEQCSIKLNAFDCVTLFETTLCFARIVKKGSASLENLVKEVQFTRYRDGILKDYTSRLHYTSEWIMNNVKKKVIKDTTAELGGEEFKLKVGFMSANPGKYRALADNPTLTPQIAKIEQTINQNSLYVIPKSKIKKIEKKLNFGDIIAIATDIEGLDYAHTGMIGMDKKGKPKFLHASLNKGKVVLDAQISKYIAKNGNQIGISVLSPLEP